MISKLTRILYYILFFLAPLVMYGGTSELFEFNKMIFIYFIATCVLFLWAVACIKEKKLLLQRTILDPFIALFFASQVLSTILSIDHHTSIFGYYGRFNGGLLSIGSYLVLYYGFVSLAALGIDAKMLVRKLLMVSVAASVVVVLWALPGRFLGKDLSCLVFTGQFSNTCWSDQFNPAVRMFSTLGQPNWLGAYLAIHFFIGLCFYVISKNGKKTVLWSAYLFLITSGVLFTRSRSAQIALLIGLALFALKVFYFQKKKAFKVDTKKAIILGVAILVPLLLFKTGSEQVDKYLIVNSKKQIVTKQTNEPQLPSEITESFDIRKIVWKGAIALGLKYPLTGTGVETFAYSYYFTRPLEHNLTSEWDFLYNKAHNEYLNYFATTGFIGIGSYLLMIGSVLYYLVINLHKRSKKTDEIRMFLICSLSAYTTILITNFFGFSTTTIQLFFYLLPALVVALLSDATSTDNKPVGLSRNRNIAIATLTLFFLYSVYYLANYVRADIAYNEGRAAARLTEYNKAYLSFNKALALRFEHVYEDAQSFNLANLAYLASFDNDKDLAGRLMKLSDSYNIISRAASPYNVGYLKTGAKNEYLFYQVDEKEEHLTRGLEYLTKAQKLAPTDPKLPYTQSIFYSLLADSAKGKEQEEFQRDAVQSLDKAITLKKDYRDAYLLKGQLLKKYGEPDAAREQFEYILKHINPQDEDVQKELSSLNTSK